MKFAYKSKPDKKILWEGRVLYILLLAKRMGSAFASVWLERKDEQLAWSDPRMDGMAGVRYAYQKEMRRLVKV